MRSAAGLDEATPRPRDVAPRPPVVFLFDDQVELGRARAALLEHHLDVSVHYASAVDDAIRALRSSTFDLCVLDYFDQSSWTDTRSGLEIVKLGIAESPHNRHSPIIIFSMFTIPADEIDELYQYGRVEAVENQLRGDEFLARVVSAKLGIEFAEDLYSAEEPKVWGRSVAELVNWSVRHAKAEILLPSWSLDETLTFEWRDLGPQLCKEIASAIKDSAAEPTPDSPLLLRVERNLAANNAYQLDVSVIEVIGPAATLRRRRISWKTPDLTIDPDAPTSTPAGGRARKRAPSAAEWASLADDWKSLDEND